MRIRACGICGTDVTFIHRGGMPAAWSNAAAQTEGLAPDQMVPVVLGREPAGEIVAVGAEGKTHQRQAGLTSRLSQLVSAPSRVAHLSTYEIVLCSGRESCSLDWKPAMVQLGAVRRDDADADAELILRSHTVCRHSASISAKARPALPATIPPSTGSTVPVTYADRSPPK